MQINLEREQENLKKRHNEVLNHLQKEFEREKSLRKHYLMSEENFSRMGLVKKN